MHPFVYQVIIFMEFDLSYLGFHEIFFYKNLLIKIIVSFQKNKLSDVNKTYIDIRNGQKFEL